MLERCQVCRIFILCSVVITGLIIQVNFVLAGQTIHVPSEASTIRKGIQLAEDGDTVLVAPGTYYENFNIDKSISLVSESGAGNTVIQGDPDESVIDIFHVKAVGNATARVSGFTIQGGRGSEGRAGGVSIVDADPIIENNIIRSNTATVDGGGIIVSEASHPTIRNNEISYNTATRFGAGIDVVNDSNPLIYDNDIIHNTTSGPTYGSGLGKWGASGAGIYVDGNSSPQIIGNKIAENDADFSGGGISLRLGAASPIEDNLIYNNTATTGAGIHIETQGGRPTIRNNTIYNNDAYTTAEFPESGFGGGISVYNASRPIIIENRIYDNFASQGGGAIVNSENAISDIIGNEIYNNEIVWDSGEWEGGGIYVADSTATIRNNTIYNNKGRLGGGIALLDNAQANIINNTIVDNTAPDAPGRASGGGIFVKSIITSATITNNIISRNTDYQVAEWGVGKAIIKNNLINDDSDGIYQSDGESVNIIDDLNDNSEASGNISGNEDFINYSGDNFDLAVDSDAIDIGLNSGAPNYDIEYNLRPFNDIVDLGAYEYSTSTLNTAPVYRFWSDSKQRHFYTIKTTERNSVLGQFFFNQWKYEGVVYRATTTSACSGGHIHRFWSDTKQGHFYTASESEKNYVIANYPVNIWNYEGAKLCAHTSSVVGTTPLYRFWSDTKQGHFYTASESEKNYVIANYPVNIWNYEKVGFYVYPVK